MSDHALLSMIMIGATVAAMGIGIAIGAMAEKRIWLPIVTMLKERNADLRGHIADLQTTISVRDLQDSVTVGRPRKIGERSNVELPVISEGDE